MRPHHVLVLALAPVRGVEVYNTRDESSDEEKADIVVVPGYATHYYVHKTGRGDIVVGNGAAVSVHVKGGVVAPSSNAKKDPWEDTAHVQQDGSIRPSQKRRFAAHTTANSSPCTSSPLAEFAIFSVVGWRGIPTRPVRLRTLRALA